MIEAGNYKGFRLEIRDPGIAWVTFDQPDRMNGFTQPMKRELAEVLVQTQMDDAIRVVVFTGSGRAFSAGDDISGVPRRYGDARQLVPELDAGHQSPIGTYDGLRAFSHALNLAIRQLDKMTIAALNGIAVQSGFALAMACDFRIASEDAKLTSGTLRFGLLPDEGAHAMLVSLIGTAKALEFFLRNKVLSAREAMEWGLVHEVTPPAELEARTISLARELADAPQVALRLLKRAIYNAADSSFAQALEDIASKTAVSDHHPDALEGMTSFQEKRKPKFNQWLSDGRPWSEHAKEYAEGFGKAIRALTGSTKHRP